MVLTGCPVRYGRPAPDSTARQLEASRRAAGGPISGLAPLITRRFPSKAVPITRGAEGKRRTLVIPGIAGITVEGFIGAGDGQAWLDDAGHFASRRVAAAKGTASRFRDHALSFDNTGQKGHYPAIEWSGG